MKKVKEVAQTTNQNVKEGNERGARRALLEELFYDFNRSRAQVYKMNFVRGLMMGIGTVIGGTLGVALILWALSMLAQVVPPLGDFFHGVSQTIEAGKR